MRRLLVCFLTFSLASLFGAEPWKLVLKDGSTVTCDGAPVIVNDTYMFRTAEGKDASLPAGQIDIEKTGRANQVPPPAHQWRMTGESAYEPPRGVITLTDANFEAEVLQSDTPVLVEFGAAWCGYCRRLEPTIQAVAREYAGRIKVARLDVDRSAAIAHRYNVFALPTLFLFDGGKVTRAILGGASKSSITRMLAAGGVPANSNGL
jgi:thioredoxin 1